MDVQSKNIQILLKELSKMDFNQDRDLVKIQKRLTSVLKSKDPYETKYLNIINTIKNYNPIVLKKFINGFTSQNKNLDIFYRTFISNPQNMAVISGSRSFDDELVSKEEQEKLKRLFDTILNIGLANPTLLTDETVKNKVEGIYKSLLDDYTKAERVQEEKSLEDIEKEYENNLKEVSLGDDKRKIIDLTKDSQTKLVLKTHADDALIEQLKSMTPIQILDFSRRYAGTNQLQTLKTFIDKYKRTTMNTNVSAELLSYIQQLNNLKEDDKKKFISSIDSNSEIPESTKNLLTKYFLSNSPEKKILTISEIPTINFETETIPGTSAFENRFRNMYKDEAEVSLYLPSMDEPVNEDVVNITKEYMLKNFPYLKPDVISDIIQLSLVDRKYVGTSDTGEAMFEETPTKDTNQYITNLGRQLTNYKLPSTKSTKPTIAIDRRYVDVSEEPPILNAVTENMYVDSNEVPLLSRTVVSKPTEAQKKDLLNSINNSSTSDTQRQANIDKLKSVLIDEYVGELERDAQGRLDKAYSEAKKELDMMEDSGFYDKELELKRNVLKAEEENRLESLKQSFVNNIDTTVQNLLRSNAYRTELAPDLFSYFDEMLVAVPATLKRKPSETSGMSEEPMSKKPRGGDTGSKRKKKVVDNHKDEVCVRSSCNKKVGDNCVHTLKQSADGKSMVDMTYCSVKCLDEHEYKEE